MIFASRIASLFGTNPVTCSSCSLEHDTGVQFIGEKTCLTATIDHHHRFIKLESPVTETASRSTLFSDQGVIRSRLKSILNSNRLGAKVLETTTRISKRERSQKVNKIEFRAMTVEDTNEVVQLISRAMNENEGRWALKTIQFHFFCKSHNIDDGRSYILGIADNKIVGITGLHSYSWGPSDLTWLGWFAVLPEYQGMKIGYQLMTKTIDYARSRGFRRLLVETYSDEDFETARRFYERYGFQVVGNISDYIKKEVDMVVFGLDL